MKQKLLRRALPALLAAILLPGPAAAQGFEGTFADRGMMLTLKEARGRYNGTLVYDGRFYAVDAEEVGGELRGRFATDKGSFDFRAYFSGEVLEFESNTIVYSLRRAGKVGRDEPASVREAPEVEPSPAPPVEKSTAPAALEVEEPPIPVVEETPLAEPAPIAEAAPTDPPAAATAAAADDSERDAGLAGVWAREAIDADAGTRLPGVTTLELAAGGSYAARGGLEARTGRWRTQRQTLLFRPAAAGDWQAYCRYRLVASTLLCSFDDGSRQLWFRR